METPIHIMESLDSDSNSDLSIDKRIPGIIFKIKKYYVVYIWSEKSLNFDILETVIKNTLIYRIFKKKVRIRKSESAAIDTLIKYQRTGETRSRLNN